MSYREPAERPKEPPIEARAPIRVVVRRSRGMYAVAFVLALVVGVGVHWFLGGAIAAIIAVVIWCVLIAVFVPGMLASQTIEIDFVARRIRALPDFDGSFADIVVADVSYAEPDSLLVLESREGKKLYIAKGMLESVNAAAVEINVVLASQYESIRDMPPMLARVMKGLDRGLPLSGFTKLAEQTQRRRIETMLEQLPVADLKVNHATRNTVLATANTRGIRVTFLYSLTKDRLEVSAARKSAHGNIELRKDREQRNIATSGLVRLTSDILVNGAANKRSFEQLPNGLPDRVLAAMARLDLRVVSIYSSETRVILRGFRELRDPQGRLGAMLDLVVEIGEGLAS